MTTLRDSIGAMRTAHALLALGFIDAASTTLLDNRPTVEPTLAAQMAHVATAASDDPEAAKELLKAVLQKWEEEA